MCEIEPRGRVLWDRNGSPSEHVGNTFSVPSWKIREIIHKLKICGNLHPRDRVVIYDSGDVTDEFGALIGNIHDEL